MSPTRGVVESLDVGARLFPCWLGLGVLCSVAVLLLGLVGRISVMVETMRGEAAAATTPPPAIVAAPSVAVASPVATPTPPVTGVDVSAARSTPPALPPATQSPASEPVPVLGATLTGAASLV